MAQEWFYITEPRGANWVATPEFRTGPPMRLASWINKGLDWGSTDEVSMLQNRIKNIIKRNTDITDVVQVMLFRRTLPCQHRPLHVWEFNPEGSWTLQRFFGMTHEDIWRLLFKAQKQKSWPETTDDIGLDCAHPATLVSF